MPELGSTGELLWACQGGRPHVKVRYLSGNRMIEYSLAPGREVTKEERGLLIELAKRAPTRAD